MESSPISKRAKDLTGQKIGRLSVLRPIGKAEDGGMIWECKCDCETIKPISQRSLRNMQRPSCGCWMKEIVTKHGLSRSPTWNVWVGIMQRCYNEKEPSYKYYGARGIKVCDRWHKFENFVEDMGIRPEGLSIDRKEVNGNYCPENCRWATNIQQARNKRNNVKLTCKGETLTIAEWAETLGVNAGSIRTRVHLGWDDERILTEPFEPSAYHQGFEYILKDSKGNEYKTSNLAEFARIHGVHVMTLETLARGGRKTSRTGWKCRYAHESEEERLKRCEKRLKEQADYAREKRHQKQKREA